MNISQVIDDPEASFDIPQVGIFNQSFVLQEAIKSLKRAKNKYLSKFHPCPIRADDFKVINYTSTDKNDFERTLPDGDYRYEHKYWNDDDDNVFTSTIYEQFKTGEDPLF
jgi:hypothetical protein